MASVCLGVSQFASFSSTFLGACRVPPRRVLLAFRGHAPLELVGRREWIGRERPHPPHGYGLTTKRPFSLRARPEPRHVEANIEKATRSIHHQPRIHDLNRRHAQSPSQATSSAPRRPVHHDASLPNRPADLNHGDTSTPLTSRMFVSIRLFEGALPMLRTTELLPQLSPDNQSKRSRREAASGVPTCSHLVLFLLSFSSRSSTRSDIGASSSRGSRVELIGSIRRPRRSGQHRNGRHLLKGACAQPPANLDRRSLLIAHLPSVGLRRPAAESRENALR